MIDFKPSDIIIVGIPLVGTLGRTEREGAAAMLISALVFHGDEWKGLTPSEMSAWWKDVAEKKTQPWEDLMGNPFFRPDFHDLVRNGHAEGSLTPESPLQLTEKAILLIGAKWRRRAA